MANQIQPLTFRCLPCFKNRIDNAAKKHGKKRNAFFKPYNLRHVAAV